MDDSVNYPGVPFRPISNHFPEIDLPAGLSKHVPNASDEEMEMDPLDLEGAVAFVHDGLELLETVEEIHYETTTGRIKVTTDLFEEFHVIVSLDEIQVVDPQAALATKLSDEHGGHWGQHPDFPASDWRHEVENNETRLGYWEWVAGKVSDAQFAESEGGEAEAEKGAA